MDILESNLLQIRLAEELDMTTEQFITRYSGIVRRLIEERQEAEKKGVVITHSEFQEQCFQKIDIIKQRLYITLSN